MTFDNHMMDVALAMARQSQGTSWPNPSVGAVIADENTHEVIARGRTMSGGRPHAETEALKAAGQRAQGKTLYVTLEPCSHVGQTAPCADAVINAGIARVVVAQTDPNPRVAGRGIKRLRNAGVQVTTGLGHSQAHEIARGHILRVTERRPFVQVKMALDAAGQIARGDGTKPQWVTGPIARAHAHMLRATTDAILIGSGTLNDDNPQLTCRLPGLEHRSPVRVVLASPDQIHADTKLLTDAPEIPLWLATGHPSDSDTAAQLGFEVIKVAQVGKNIWLPALVEALVARGITRLLIEGGPTIWRAFANAGLVDQVVAFIAQGDNSDSGNTKALAGIKDLLPGVTLDLTSSRRLGSDHMYKFKAS